jgi:hypothetical protein
MRPRLSSSQNESEIAANDDGYRVDFITQESATVDPRAFAIYKQYVGTVEWTKPIKARKDGDQAKMIHQLLTTELVHLPLSEGVRRLFPR